MDTQQIGIIGKHILIAHLIAADLEVAEPIRDHGIDLIVFRDRAGGDSFFGMSNSIEDCDRGSLRFG